MRILVDTDVLLDVAMAREPHVSDSEEVFRWVAAGGCAAVAWHSLVNCAYFLKGGRKFLSEVAQRFEVPETGRADALRALSLPMRDIEDAFQAAAALAWNADHIVTRNVRDYRNSPVPAVMPSGFLKRIRRS